MTKSRKRKSVSVGVMISIITTFTIVAAGILWSIQVKAQEVNETLQIEQQHKKELELKVIEMQEINEKIMDEMEQLKEEVQELELKLISKKEREANQKIAYLTFDDGPSNNTIKILDILKEKNVPATFFVVGNQERKDVYKRIVDEGHTLGNHTYGHDYKGIYKSPETFFADVDKLNDLLEEATGERSNILRFPGGSNNTVSRRAGGADIMNIMTEAVTENGYRYFDWNVDSMDASKAVQSKDVIVRSVLNGAQYTKKAVILMHDAPAKTTTVDALPEIIDGLTKKGFIFRGLNKYSPQVQF